VFGLISSFASAWWHGFELVAGRLKTGLQIFSVGARV